MVPYDGLEAARVDASRLAYYAHEFVLVFVLGYDHVGWRMMLLVAHEYVRHERALARQKRNGHLDGLTVPVLRVLALEALLLDNFLQLMQEAVLRSHAEVADGQEAHLFEEELARKLQLYCRLRQEVLQRERRYLHDVADVETVDPLRLVQVAQDVLHVARATVVRAGRWLG